jgi:aldose sugar dehydrogenase
MMLKYSEFGITNLLLRLNSEPAIVLGILILAVLIGMSTCYEVFSVDTVVAIVSPRINDSNLMVQTVVTGLKSPTNMAFLDENNILVAEKDNGTVRWVREGELLQEPILDVNAASERGVLGIDVLNSSGKLPTVYLYVSEAGSFDGGEPIGNRVYRYSITNDSAPGVEGIRLTNSSLLLDLPIPPRPNHDGGELNIGMDRNIYLTLGDPNKRTKAQNVGNGSNPDGTSGILRIGENGTTVGTGLFGSTHPLDKYYAYGIRNSFGFDFDPVTAKMWESENGLDRNDEINLVEPGFNSGWRDLMGAAPAGFNFSNLESFGGRGNYSDPEFIWKQNVAPTAVKFLDSDKLGKSYLNDLFVADYNRGRIYRFDLNADRTGVVVSGVLADKVANTDSETQSIIFGDGFGRITDLQVGPGDGYLYVLSISEGAIYKILPG